MEFFMKGLYVMSETPIVNRTDITEDYRMLVYPVPIPGAHNLGIHSSLTTDGYLKIGPTVLPAFGQENYYGLENVTPKSLAHTLKAYWAMARAGPDSRAMIRSFILNDLPKNFNIASIVKEGNKLQKMDGSHFKKYGRPGIRP
jgi:(S)-2-hydroxyglutarate dehydrogenase